MEIIITLVSFIVGILIGNIFHKGNTLGDLRIDRSDPSCEPYLFLELDTDVRNIMNKRHVTFRVKVENFIPHE